jgi:hypothetical protein
VATDDSEKVIVSATIENSWDLVRVEFLLRYLVGKGDRVTGSQT